MTTERGEHVKARREDIYNCYVVDLKEAVEKPNYIVRDKTDLVGTAVILHKIKEGVNKGDRLRVVLSLSDDEYLSNSIITYMKISEKRMKQYLKKADIVFQSE